jgi:Mor family transcriptional regulator
MFVPDLLESLKADDLPNDGLQFIANTCGIEVARALLRNCPGMRFDIPLRPKRSIAKRYVEIHYDGSNARILARQIRMSEAFVYKVLSEKSEIKHFDG